MIKFLIADLLAVGSLRFDSRLLTGFGGFFASSVDFSLQMIEVKEINLLNGPFPVQFSPTHGQVLVELLVASVRFLSPSYLGDPRVSYSQNSSEVI